MDMFEKNLKYYRVKKNRTIIYLSEACGITAMSVSNVLRSTLAVLLIYEKSFLSGTTNPQNVL